DCICQGIDSVPFLCPIKGRWSGDHGYENAVVICSRARKGEGFDSPLTGRSEMQKKSLEMKPRRSADSGKSLEWLPKPSQATSCSHHAFGRNLENSLHCELPEANFWRETISS